MLLLFSWKRLTKKSIRWWKITSGVRGWIIIIGWWMVVMTSCIVVSWRRWFLLLHTSSLVSFSLLASHRSARFHAPWCDQERIILTTWIHLWNGLPLWTNLTIQSSAIYYTKGRKVYHSTIIELTNQSKIEEAHLAAGDSKLLLDIHRRLNISWVCRGEADIPALSNSCYEIRVPSLSHAVHPVDSRTLSEHLSVLREADQKVREAAWKRRDDLELFADWRVGFWFGSTELAVVHWIWESFFFIERSLPQLVFICTLLVRFHYMRHLVNTFFSSYWSENNLRTAYLLS